MQGSFCEEWEYNSLQQKIGFLIGKSFIFPREIAFFNWKILLCFEGSCRRSKRGHLRYLTGLSSGLVIDFGCLAALSSPGCPPSALSFLAFHFLAIFQSSKAFFWSILSCCKGLFKGSYYCFLPFHFSTIFQS